jgi:hypothetical protein
VAYPDHQTHPSNSQIPLTSQSIEGEGQRKTINTLIETTSSVSQTFLTDCKVSKDTTMKRHT